MRDGSYPAVASALSTGVIFDWFMGVLVMCFAFTQGVFPSLCDFSKLPAFDISFFVLNMRFTLFLLTALGILFLIAFALLWRGCKAFWQRVRQGFTILRDRRRYRREMASWQFASWIARFASYWFLLDAFHIGGSVRNALLVLGVQVVASVFPFTPGGAGVQQALLLTIFAGNPYVASFSVGQQIATAVLTTVLGFAALVLIFRFRSFREVIARERRTGAARRWRCRLDADRTPLVTLARWQAYRAVRRRSGSARPGRISVCCATVGGMISSGVRGKADMPATLEQPPSPRCSGS